MARIFERTLDAYLEKNDPWKRQERREKRASRKAHAEVEVEVEIEAEKVTAKPAAADDAASSRTIATALRDGLLIRAGQVQRSTTSSGRVLADSRWLAFASEEA